MDGTFGYLLLSLMISKTDTCLITDKDPQLLYSNSTHVFLQEISSGVVIEINEQIYDDIVSVDLNDNNGDIYLMNFSHILRQRCNAKSEVQTIYQSQYERSNYQAQLSSFAVDSTNDKIYWVEGNSTYRTDLLGTKTETVLTGLSNPLKFILDTTNRWIYFSERRPVNAISKCRFDGSSRKTIILDVLSPYGMAIDYKEERLYWSDAARYHMMSANLDGSDKKLFSVDVSSLNLKSIVVMGLDIFQDYVYVSELGSGIYRIKKNEKNAVPSLFTNGENFIYDLKITKKEKMLLSVNGVQTQNSGRLMPSFLVVVICRLASGRDF